MCQYKSRKLMRRIASFFQTASAPKQARSSSKIFRRRTPTLGKGACSAALKPLQLIAIRVNKPNETYRIRINFLPTPAASHAIFLQFVTLSPAVPWKCCIISYLCCNKYVKDSLFLEQRVQFGSSIWCVLLMDCGHLLISPVFHNL